jgi:small subunit ribosomal protein S1
MMSEGTSIGKVENIEDFDVKDQDVPSPDNELKATKIGEMSEFEKSFISETDEKAPESQEDSAVVADEAQESTAKKSLKSELEKFLDEETAQVFDYEDGDVIIGTVRSVEKSGVLVDFKFKSDGYVSNSELGHNEEGQVETLEAGQKVPFYIEKLETKEGYSLLSRKKAQMEETWDFLTQAIKEREPINVQVNSKVDGGLVASYQSIKGFIPASQILKENDLGLEQFINSTMSVTVLQADRRRRKVIFSSKATKLVDRKSVNKIIEELEVGQIRKGKVTSIKKFGVFVDLGGVEGLIHISELSWSRVYNPSDIVSVDDEVDVFVLGVDKETKRISLGMKQLSEDPWVKAGNELAIGDVVEGQITRIVPFGAFIQINENIEGLIHISEISYEHIEKVESILNIGDSVKAKVIKLIIEEQKIGLTLKFDNAEQSTVETVESEAAVQDIDGVEDTPAAEIQEEEAQDTTDQ